VRKVQSADAQSSQVCSQENFVLKGTSRRRLIRFYAGKISKNQVSYKKLETFVEQGWKGPQ
jgi:hypothetical protein